ncbi:hypothetical protein [Stenotrophomonas maltophilia]|uniref:hypothetical protein n=1 Tax=Stenotrophomonas maltophilia TaxID=40324 RepID=UPI001660C98A|nr:hypothetical protein [Stenotrophomonas maltophilia]MCU1160367.1 hypothetical protein [Stenotrophomonas maltophilia]
MSNSPMLSLAERFALDTLKFVKAGGRVDAQTAKSLFSLKLVINEEGTEVSGGGDALIDLLEAREAAYFTRIAMRDLLAEVDRLDAVVQSNEELVRQRTHQPKDPYFGQSINKYRAKLNQSVGSENPNLKNEP